MAEMAESRSSRVAASAAAGMASQTPDHTRASASQDALTVKIRDFIRCQLFR